ncbi:hypothetical protein VQ02_19855 [Methylobacterium variabile]|uniref:Uncharacterized protein n=1 Tax=Methylobacterium variabile TaxID=298794 RepID=A0A0J6V4S7_9HYPH|nr:hypothetical protein [Methylobacterium variabile]KMO33901.1 hypothetical protein VQ02_19855 [Methylobacterium variabile]
MRRIYGYGLGAFALAATAVGAQQYQNWVGPNGEQMPGFVLGCPTGVARQVVPCGGMGAPLNVMTAPFVRAVPDPIIFDGVTTTPKQFAVTKPATATTYRFVNPCDVDIRIRRVGSMSETVTATTGIRYLARTSEVVGTSNPSFVSIMAVSPPSSPCAPELLYGNGS